ncbi:helix-turn-helix domain-containing protein [Sporolituus thermophilus]|uniref:Helix-turn-helix n=1 Tax=Sporolituus thermophilus DSM 23256 TaxID=1123285 RepID=A0A1G7JUZ0_9FIRM|nr:helix-turn-helix transcriptional regulator [Sporolituus thermophilus]SDF28604.1 Helix-turn-helix [Sporolituus thermophilus DSM 23256]
MVGDRIKAVRLQAGMTTEQLAKLANVSQPYISQIENNYRHPSYNTLVAIARALGVPVEYLETGENTDRPPAKCAGECPGADGAACCLRETLNLDTLVDYAEAIANAKTANITPAELNEAVEALKKLKKLSGHG